MVKETKQVISEHMANERTFLAWVRTGIGIMVFGFVIVKFSLFVNQLPASFFQKANVTRNSFTNFMGIGFVLTGTLVILLSYFKYKKTYKQLQKGEYFYSTGLLTALTVIISLMSIFLIGYLIMTAYALDF
ncbi:putative membrane protein [Flavobacterium aquidurense]|uniref:DUF202 domain-containing protein n=1 Tax=Flavobacterium frigidimaris TaxID=262320 RepID=A0ABX4BLB9_FLAFR|nr:DUF202 domain-containing protein [Flavobacterium frigidimaris]OXA76547.1 hypothetical protein B0A65_18725 [Flavobacterium frigidimaris]SDZ66935.1 putative membrane protein [Flavobacterium aquidurense]